MVDPKSGLPALVALALACAPLTAAPAPAGDVVAGNNAFAADLFGKLREEPGNLFFSPYSISTALAMTYGGARRNTEAQMAKVLHFGPGQERLHAAFQALIAALDAGGAKRAYQLHTANALWGQQGYKFLDPFLKLCQTRYGGGLRQLDFKTATEASRQRINLWVEDQTQKKIQNLLPRGVVRPDTRLVLTNAIYFKGDWSSPFEKRRTQDAPFTVQDGSKVQVPMMAQTDRFGYTATPDLQVLEMPYAGRGLSMLVVLPRKPDGLPAVEASLTARTLAGWLRIQRWCKVHVFVPRFTMTSMFSLAKVLRALGMTDAFSPQLADFSGMTGKTAAEYGLYISAVIHKAFVEVNEKGTEAAAATAVVMAPGSAMPVKPPPIPTFRADRPFLFVIRHNRTGSILFMGRVANPK